MVMMYVLHSSVMNEVMIHDPIVLIMQSRLCAFYIVHCLYIVSTDIPYNEVASASVICLRPVQRSAKLYVRYVRAQLGEF